MENILITFTEEAIQVDNNYATTENQQQPVSNTLSLHRDVIDILVQQHKREIENSLLYKSIANWLYANNYKSYIFWEKEADEEMKHANTILTYLNDNFVPILMPNDFSKIDITINTLRDCIILSYDREAENLTNLKNVYLSVKDYIEKNVDMYLDEILHQLIANQIKDIKKYSLLLSYSERTQDMLLLDNEIMNLVNE